MSKKDDVFEQIIERAKKDGSYYATYSTKKHMSKKDEALKLALEYRPTMNEEVLHSWATEMKKAAQEALAEQPAQQQEPEYAWPTVADYERDVGFQTNEAFRIAWNMARTTNRMLGHASSQPAQRTWVGLTDEEKADLFEGTAPYYNETDYADAIEAKLKEKNT